MQKPPFLKSTSSDSSSSSSSKDRFPNRPQKSGSTNQPDGDSEKFPNRPQESGGTDCNPQSVPSGGKLPYPGPPKSPGKPFKLKG